MKKRLSITILAVLFHCSYWNGYEKMKDEERLGKDLIPICFIDWKRNSLGTPGKSTNGMLGYANKTLYEISRRSDYSRYFNDGFVKLTKNNILFSSQDDGRTWKENSLPDQTQISEFQSIYFSTDTFVLIWKTKSTAIPIQVSYSKDLNEWKTFATNETNSNKISFFDKDNIWAYTNSKIYKYDLTTGNMDLLFTTPTAEQTDGEVILDIKFINPQVGYFISKSYLKKTTDAGLTWAIIYTMSNDSISDFFVLNSTSIWLRSIFPKLYYSADGGTSFLSFSLGETLKSGKMIFINGNNGIISGKNNLLYLTSDSGSNWKISSLLATSPISDFIFTAENIGYLSSQSQLFKTYDLGVTWVKQTDTIDNFTYEFINPLMTNANLLLWICLGVAKYSGHPPDKK